jgi:DNA-binding response OmpR family regulator
MTKRILLADDERSIRESLSKILRAENYELCWPKTARKPSRNTRGLAHRPLDLDLNMPVKNGSATLKWLAEINPVLPVVIITGRSNQRALAETAGADALMEKPLDVPLLLQTIRELMDEPIENPHPAREPPRLQFSIRALRRPAISRNAAQTLHSGFPCLQVASQPPLSVESRIPQSQLVAA